MNLNQLAKEITKHEGLKKQVDIAQVKEIIRVIIQLMATEPGAANCLYNNMMLAQMNAFLEPTKPRTVAIVKKKRKAKKK